MSARQRNVVPRDRVRDRRPQDRRRPSRARSRSRRASDRDTAPAQAGLPRARSVHAHQVGDPDAEPDHEDRSPPGRVDDPRGADRGRRGAQLQPDASARGGARSICTTAFATLHATSSATSSQSGVSAIRCGALQPRDRERSRPGPAVKTSNDAPTTPSVRVPARGHAFHKGDIGQIGAET